MLRPKGVRRDDKKPVKKPEQKPVVKPTPPKKPMPTKPSKPSYPDCEYPVRPKPSYPDCDYPMLPTRPKHPESMYPCPYPHHNPCHRPHQRPHMIMPGMDLNHLMMNPMIRRCVLNCLRQHGCIVPMPRMAPQRPPMNPHMPCRRGYRMDEIEIENEDRYPEAYDLYEGIEHSFEEYDYYSEELEEFIESTDSEEEN